MAFIRDRYLIPREKRNAFLRRASLFEDVVVRCVRYAFAHIPPRIGRVFFAREVALPFLWFRLLRHGYRGSPIHWREHRQVACCPQVVFGSWMLTRFPERIPGHLAEQGSGKEA